ncbi:sensor histidine kinase [Ancylomarina sp. YFZ004]
MKLLTKINRSYLKYGFFLFILANIIISSILSHFEKINTDIELRYGAMEISKVIKNHGDFPNIPPTYQVTIIDTDKIVEGTLKDTILFDPEDREMDVFREYSYSQIINETNYLITHRQFAETFLEVFFEITPVVSIVLLLIFLGFIFFSRAISYKLWQTFNENIEQIKGFSFTSSDKLHLKTTGIDELDDLNHVLTKMADRLNQDYQASKEFSANAAHEFQTPLAIIQNKCENLFSDSELKPKTIESIREIYISTDRLSGITKALLLLAKIDHGLFQDKKLISINEVLKDWLLSFDEIIEDNKIIISISENVNLKTHIDKRLANLLIQNLLTNAIKNSPENKKIEILIDEGHFSISNYGEKTINQPEKLFDRFYKESQLNSSSGIGLAIVKKIIDYSDFSIHYSFNNFNHIFTVKLIYC